MEARFRRDGIQCFAATCFGAAKLTAGGSPKVAVAATDCLCGPTEARF
jgi:hypothetical protein